MRRLTVILMLVNVISFSVLMGCKTIPKDALRLSPESLQQRQMQTRKYETTDETKILIACAGLLQDMGFNLDESETELGLIVASKMRSAVNAGQQVVAVLVGLLSGAMPPTDKEQKMRVSIVTRPVDENHTAVRVTFQRIVWDTQGQVTKREGITDPDIYQEFFAKLSKSIFLEAHSI